LPTLQCYSTLIRQFYGTMDASGLDPGLIAAGLQDNGNVFCNLSPVVTPWRHADSGDGGWNAFLGDGGYAHNVMGEPIQVSAESAGQIVTNTVPVTSPAPGDPTGIIGPVAESVAQPRHHNAAGQLLVAVAAVKNIVYGLYADPQAQPPYRWEMLGSIPADEYVAGLGSFLGERVFAGTGSGKIYVLEVASGKVVAQTVNLPRPTPRTVMQGGAVLRIVGFSDTAMFALLIGAREAPNSSGGVSVPFIASLVPTYVLRLDGNVWNVTAGAGLPNEFTYGLVAVVAPQTRIPHGLLVSTDNEVYLSRDDGQNWQPAASGLPRRPHGGDLRFVLDRKGGANIYLGTFGRSVWNLKLR
jgi:hypothetical protein